MNLNEKKIPFRLSDVSEQMMIASLRMHKIVNLIPKRKRFLRDLEFVTFLYVLFQSGPFHLVVRHLVEPYNNLAF